MEWFRFYHEALEDPKVQKMHPSLFKHWVNILCLASKGTPRGTIPNLQAIAFALRLRTVEAQDIVDKLVSRDLLHRMPSGCYEPHNWMGRQRQSDDVAQRVSHHRAKKRPDVTLQDSPGNVLDTETETETENTELTSFVPPPEPAATPPDLSPIVDNPDEQETEPDETPEPAPSRWDRFVADYKRAGRNGAAQVGVLTALYRDYHGPPDPPSPRLAKLLKEAGSGEALAKAIVESSARTFTDDPLDYIDKMVRNRGSPKASTRSDQARQELAELLDFAEGRRQIGR